MYRLALAAALALTSCAAPARDVPIHHAVLHGDPGDATRLEIDGSVIIPQSAFERFSADRAEIKGTFRGGGRTYLVIEAQNTGFGCPSSFFAVDLTTSRPVASDGFGNCTSVVPFSVDPDGSLRATFPPNQRNPRDRGKVVRFRDGVLTGN